jgi:hypothetical protein
MADITMCSGKDCKVKEKCYRHTAQKSEYFQSYFLNPPVDEKGNCEYYWNNKPKRTK